MKIDDPRRPLWLCERDGCDVEFPMWRADRRFCSPKCRVAGHYKAKRKDRECSTENEALGKDCSGGGVKPDPILGGETTVDAGTVDGSSVDSGPPLEHRGVG